MQVFGPEEEELLGLARDWRDWRLGKVHPSLGAIFNSLLVRAGEEAVPFRRRTDSQAPTLSELIRREHGCAPEAGNGRKMASASPRSSAAVQEQANVGRR